MKKILTFILLSLTVGACTSTTASNTNLTQPSSSTVKDNNLTQQAQNQTTSKIPPMSAVTFELCHTLEALNGPCITLTKEQIHWGEIKEIKLINVSDIKQVGAKNTLQVHVKSQGCYGYYDSPQKEAWYPISGLTWAIKGKTAETRLVTNRKLPDMSRGAIKQIYGNASFMIPDQCEPIEIK